MMGFKSTVGPTSVVVGFEEKSVYDKRLRDHLAFRVLRAGVGSSKGFDK